MMSWTRLIFLGEWLCGVNLHPLNQCAILDWCHLVRSMLGRDWFGVLVLCEGFIDISGHVAISMSSRVVPGELYAAKKRTCHVNCNGVVLLQCVDKVVHLMHVGNFDAKVIYHQAESDVPHGTRDQVYVGIGSNLVVRCFSSS
jgi:hypothetical protein